MAMKVKKKEPKRNKTIVKFRKKKINLISENKELFVLGKGKVKNKKENSCIVPLKKQECLSSKPNVDGPPVWVQTKVASRNQKAANDISTSGTYDVSQAENLVPGKDIPSSELDKNPNSESFRLRSWFYSYTGIGLDYNRPVSDSNPALFCSLDISESEKRELLKRNIRSKIRKQQTQGIQFESHRGQNWRGKPRPLTVLQLLKKAVNQKWPEQKIPKNYDWKQQDHVVKDSDYLYEDFKLVKRSASYRTSLRYTNTLRKMEYHRQNAYEREYQKYQSTLQKFTHRQNSPMDVVWSKMLNGIKYASVFYVETDDSLRYLKWLAKHEPLNQWVDFYPFKHYSPHMKRHYGNRKEGERAAEFASNRRFLKNMIKNSVREEHDKWYRYLCYYSALVDGKINIDQLIAVSRWIWGETNSIGCVLFNVTKVKEPKQTLCLPPPAKVAINPVKPKTQSRIIIPSVSWSNQEAERVSNSILQSQHPSGHSNNEVCSLLVKQAWKNLPGMLIQVPESFDEKTFSVDLTSSNVDNTDKQPQLKTG